MLFNRGLKNQLFRGNLKLIALFISLFMFYNVDAQTPNPDMPVTNNHVFSAAIDGNYTYIGGTFTFVGPNSGYGAKVTTTNSAFDKLYPKVNGLINACISDGAGGWYIGGTFTIVGTFPRNRIAHIMQDGTIDAGWNPDADNSVYSLALRGTDLFVGGVFTTIGGQSRNRIAKISTTGDGSADATWNPGSSGAVTAIVLSGTDLFTGGLFSTIGGVSRSNIAKLSTEGTGTVDATWNPGINNLVSALAISGTDLFAGGAFAFAGGLSRYNIAKLSTEGTGIVDATWNPGSTGSVYTLAISGSDLFVGGGFYAIGGQSRNSIAKLSTQGTGTVDASWNPNSSSSVYSIVISGTNLFAGGDFTSIGGLVRNRIAKLATTGTGSADATWDPSSSGYVNSIAVFGDDIYFGGNFTSINGLTRNRIAKIDNTTGEVDPDWNPDINHTVLSLVVNGSYIYAGGSFTSVNTSSTPVTRNRLARFSTTGAGTVDVTWDPYMNGIVYALAIDGSDIYAGGIFSAVNSLPAVTRNNLAKFPLTSPATVDNMWDPNLNGTVSALGVSGTDIYVGGLFTQVNGSTTRNYLAKFPLTGNATVDAWDPNLGNSVYALAISGSEIYAGGAFTTVNGGTPKSRLAKFPLTSPATVDAWNPDISGTVQSLAVSGTDIYAGGVFTTVNGGTERNYLAKLSTLTGIVDSWNPICASAVNTIVTSGSDVYVGGLFRTVGGLFQPYLALFTDRALPVELVSFTASVTKGVVNLSWQTATEVDNHGFEVERATPGTNDWQKIGFIEGHFTTNSPKYYSFFDNPSATNANKFKYRLKQIDNSGSYEYSNVIEVSLETPGNFLLEQNYPNPFNPSTVIRFQLPVSGMVNIDLYNMTGEKISTLLNETKESGVHSLSFDAIRHGLSSGIYFYKMTVVSNEGEVFSSVRKFSLIK